MIEIEVKAKIEDIKKIREKLEFLGCNFGEPKHQEDKIFLPNGMEFSEIRKGTPVLRIRNSNGKITMTLKKRLIEINDQIKLEKEILIDNEKTGIEIIENIGFHKVIEVKKRRVSCEYKDMTLCLDSVSGLGEFIEVEKLASEGHEETIQESLFDFLKNLGLSEADKVAKGYDTLLYEKSVDRTSEMG